MVPITFAYAPNLAKIEGLSGCFDPYKYTAFYVRTETIIRCFASGSN